MPPRRIGGSNSVAAATAFSLVVLSTILSISNAQNCEVDSDCLYIPGAVCCAETCIVVECCRDDHCDDGISCTVDQCIDGACSHLADDLLCPNGDTYGSCGYATCVPLVGCVPMPNVANCPPVECSTVACVEVPCNETFNDTCDPPELHSKFECVYTPDPLCGPSSSSSAASFVSSESTSYAFSSSSVPASESASSYYFSSSAAFSSVPSECTDSSDCAGYPSTCNETVYCLNGECIPIPIDDPWCCNEDPAACYMPCGMTHCDLATGLCMMDVIVDGYDAGTPWCCVSDADCEDDGDECTLEYCTTYDYCEYHVDPQYECCKDDNCYDYDPCTSDHCELSNRTCSNVPIEPCCRSDAECDDGKACTSDACIAGQCYNVEQCYDGLFCTIDGCDPVTGECTHEAVSCDDADPCTDDACTEGLAGYQCQHYSTACPVEGASCLMGCLTTTCRSLTALFGGFNYALATCGSGFTCDRDVYWPYVSGDGWTMNPYVAGSGVLTFYRYASDEVCDVAADCTSVPYATTTECVDNPFGGGKICKYTQAVDYSNCTLSYVDHYTGAVVNQSSCDVGPWPDYFCQVPECRHYGSDDPFGTCVFVENDCDDGDECTVDCCDEGSDSCGHYPISGCGIECEADADCDDGLVCTVDSCDPAGICHHDPVVAFDCCESEDSECDDEDPCTSDTCDAELHVCDHASIPGCSGECDTAEDCEDGLVCTIDVCNATGFCRYDPIVAFECCESEDSECDDADPCTVDTCDSHACNHAPIPGCGAECEVDADCDDGVFCTVDTCDPEGVCHHDPVVAFECCESEDAECTDGDPCTLDSCESHVCEHVPTSDCCETSDDCPASDDACVGEPTCVDNACEYPPISGCCNPLHPCLVEDHPCYERANCTSESVDVAGVCRYGGVPIPGCCATDADCEDGDLCTANYCSTSTNSCDWVPELCYDGNECTTDYCVNDECQHDWIPECCYADSHCADDDLCTVDSCLQPGDYDGDGAAPHEITHVYYR